MQRRSVIASKSTPELIITPTAPLAGPTPVLRTTLLPAAVVAAALVSAALLAALAGHGVAAAEAPGAGRDALRQIVQEQCTVSGSQKRSPAPCERIVSGAALLADRKGGAHYLLIPIKTMTGIDASDLLDPETPNFFAVAWDARDSLDGFLGRPVPREAVALAVNNAHSRSQNQFHIHIACIRPDVAAVLKTHAEALTDHWSAVPLGGSSYDVLRVMGQDLGAANPFELLAGQRSDSKRHIGDYTFVVVGMTYAAGPGFAVITGTGPTGELLLDASCAVAN